MASKVVADFLTTYGLDNLDADEVEAKALELAGDFTQFETSTRNVEMKFIKIPFVEALEADWKLVSVTPEGMGAFLRATRCADEAIQAAVGNAANALLQAAGEAEAAAGEPEGLALVTALADDTEE